LCATQQPALAAVALHPVSEPKRRAAATASKQWLSRCAFGVTLNYSNQLTIRYATFALSLCDYVGMPAAAAAASQLMNSNKRWNRKARSTRVVWK